MSDGSREASGAEPKKQFISNEFLAGMGLQLVALVFSFGVMKANIDQARVEVKELRSEMSKQADIRDRTVTLEVKLSGLTDGMRRIEGVLERMNSLLSQRAGNDPSSPPSVAGGRR